MPASLSGRTLIDPQSLFRDCRDRCLPTEGWYGLANSYRCPLGRGPGLAAVLCYRRDVDGVGSLDLTKDLTLTFGDGDGNSLTVKKLTMTRADRVVSSWDDSELAPYLVRLADRRLHLARIPLDRAYNLRKSDGSGYLTPTLNSGVAWTWAQMTADIWGVLRAADATLPAWPGLPAGFTPDGTPEGFAYFSGYAWEAINDALDRLACALKYDPLADTFSVVRLGAADAAAVRQAQQWEPFRVRDDLPFDPVRGWRPEKVRVVFSRSPGPATGDPPDYSVTVTLAAAAGVVPGTVVTLRDDNAALGATGTPSNSVALATRASERAADWLRERSGFGSPARLQYRGARDGGKLIGPTLVEWAVHDRGEGQQGGVRTEAVARPTGLGGRWAPLGATAAGTSPPPPPPGTIGGGKLKGKLDATLNFGSSATVSIWDASADTGDNVTGYDWLLLSGETIPSGTQVTVFWDPLAGRWYVDGAQC